MNARHELKREAETIMLAGGFTEARAEHFGPWWRVYGKLAGDNEHVGTTHLQADPQDPREMARTLVLRAKAEQILDEPAAPETVEDTFPQGEGPFDPQPEASETPQDETHGETGEGADGAESNSHVHADGLDEADLHADVSGGDAESGASDFAGEGIVEADADRPENEALDADYTLPQIELIEPDPDPDFGAELLEVEGEFADTIKELEYEADLAALKEEEAPSGAFIFGDNLDQKRTALAGVVGRIAEDRVSAIEAAVAEQPGEYASLLGFVTTNLDKFTGAFSLQDEASLAKYHRWLAIDAATKNVARVDRYRRDTTRAILKMTHKEIQTFDPEAGWP